MPQPDDFLVKRKAEADRQNPAPDAEFTYFSPPGEEQRFRFLVTREAGDHLSILPSSDARFKAGLRAWRWKEREGGEPETWIVTKTRPNRIDLRRLAAQGGEAPEAGQ